MKIKFPKHEPAGNCKAKIDYPCSWQYKIIGESITEIRNIVQAVVVEEYTLTESNVSSGGRYVSMNLELTVQSEDRRLELYRVLAAANEIKVVI